MTTTAISGLKFASHESILDLEGAVMMVAHPENASEGKATVAFQRIEAPRGQAEIDAFVKSALSTMDHAAHPGQGAMAAEHMATMNLVSHADASHVAINHGSWFDPETWAGGRIPGDGARVLITDGIEVTYEGVSDAELFTVRVDGHLTFATDVDSTLRVDTMVTSNQGWLTIGTAEAPVEDGVQVEILFTNGGAIDTTWDPMLLSRGLIAHGKTTIHGSKTDSHAKVAVDPMAGDTQVKFAELPTGWEVDDEMVIAGTRFEGHKWDNDIRAVRWHETEDEVRTISRIEKTEAGVVVHFDEPLKHDHDTPRADLKTSVANMSRNIVFATEDAGNAEVHERAHIMFMHSDKVDVRYSEYRDLGRTDKSERAFDFDDVTEMTPDMNMKGRYAFHLHKTGVADLDNPAMVVGNAVSGSPGWGFVHHDSNAVLHNNASFDTFGAGYVAETGNETGSWTDNIAIGVEGLNRDVKNNSDVIAFDLARTGDGFWFQGRMVESSDNIAASVNHGFVFLHRGSEMLKFDAATHDHPEIFSYQKAVGADDAPIQDFRNNEVFAASEGVRVVKANPNQEHDLRSHLDGFTAWEVRQGAHLEYTSHYTLSNFDLIGKVNTPFNNSSVGISIGTNTSDIVIANGHIENFGTAAIDLRKAFTDKSLSDEVHSFHVVNMTFGNGQIPFVNYNPDFDNVVDAPPTVVSPRLALNGPLTYKEGYPDPEARKVVISGTKTDSLGETTFPAGTDSASLGLKDVVNILESDGYFTTPAGKRVFVIEILFEDRLTGEIIKEGHLVEINDNVPLGSKYFIYKNAVYSGEIDPDSLAPITQSDTAITMAGKDVVLDLLGNDMDPDGDALEVGGILQPKNGDVFVGEDGTVTYRPDLDFVGVDKFSYWAKDGQGNFTKGSVSVEVEAPTPGPMPGPAPVERAAGFAASWFEAPKTVSKLSDIDFTGQPVAKTVLQGLAFGSDKANDPFWQDGKKDYFAGKITGDIRIDKAGAYTFSLRSDDGSSMWIDGERVIGNDGLHAALTRTVTMNLDAGFHPIEVLYFERTGHQVLELTWMGSDTGGVFQKLGGAAVSHSTATPVDPGPVIEPEGPTEVPDLADGARTVYVSRSNNALDAFDLARIAGFTGTTFSMPALADWLVEHPEFGTMEKPFDAETGSYFFRLLTSASDGASSDRLLLEKGYDYDIRTILDEGASGTDADNPIVISAWGEGSDPLVTSPLGLSGGDAANILVMGVDFRGGATISGVENVRVENVTFFDGPVSISGVDHFDFADSQVVGVDGRVAVDVSDSRDVRIFDLFIDMVEGQGDEIGVLFRGSNENVALDRISVDRDVDMAVAGEIGDVRQGTVTQLDQNFEEDGSIADFLAHHDDMNHVVM